jgi:hypothetical protein
MNAGRLDKLVMLFSADWFLPYWFTLGIGMSRERRVPFQEGCREIVKQIMSGAREYWLTNFSDERVDKTHSMLGALLSRCQADEHTIDKITALIAGEEISKADEATGWLVLSITEKLLQDSLEDAPKLDTGIKEAVVKVWGMVNQPHFPEIDFEHLCLSSKSDWDVFIRNTTPDLPTMLADYLSAIASTDKFELFWATINANLATNKRQELLDWYRMVAESMTGEPLRLPQEV